MYTIGQVSELFGLPISTLRYYDKEGLFPTMQRDSGIRKFGEKELEALRVIECLKKSGLEIKDIKQFMEWCVQGSETYPQRRELFLHQKAAVEAEIERMNRVLDMLRFKCWYYEQAIQDGNEDRLSSLQPEEMPEEIRRAYENAHKHGCVKRKVRRANCLLSGLFHIFKAPRNDTWACPSSFYRTRWLPQGSGRCTPYSGCSRRPRQVYRFES